MGVISLAVFPIIFGPIGIVLGVIAKSKNEAKANLAITISVIGTVSGMILGALFWGSF